MHLVLLLGYYGSVSLQNFSHLAFGVVPMLPVCLDVCLDISPFIPLTNVKVQEYDVWLVYDPSSIPRQLRFSLYSGAVITEGLM